MRSWSVMIVSKSCQNRSKFKPERAILRFDRKKERKKLYRRKVQSSSSTVQLDLYTDLSTVEVAVRDSVSKPLSVGRGTCVYV